MAYPQGTLDLPSVRCDAKLRLDRHRGFNCGVGPTHLAEQLKRLPVDGKPLTVMPNSGYPKQENSRLVFVSSPDYFAQTTAELVTCRTRLIGGCCGTTPHHIHALRQALVGVEPAKAHPQASIRPPILPQVPAHPRLVDGLTQNKFTIAVELNPPRTSQMEPLIAAARQLQLAGVDTITVTDSPLARVKMDSVCCASRLARAGLPILPHFAVEIETLMPFVVCWLPQRRNTPDSCYHRRCHTGIR